MVRFLLDSNVLVYLDQNPGRLPERVIEQIDRADEIYVSAVSGWELSIKQALGALRLNAPVSKLVEALGLIELPISMRHGEEAGKLPPLHRDPFDRLLVAQAFAEGLTLVTSDHRLAAYGIPVLLV